jgi:hypothetical protein
VTNRFSRREDRDNNMATEGRRYAGRKRKAENLAEIDKEIDKQLIDIRKEIEKLALQMQQKAKSRWVYEWPMREPKVKWPVKELMVMRQHRLIRGWLRYAESLNGREENEIQMCEPETERDLSDAEDEMGSAEDSTDCQEGREEIPNCQVGKELRSLRDLTDCHEENQGISIFQVGNESRSLWDLIDYQEGRERFPDFPGG